MKNVFWRQNPFLRRQRNHQDRCETAVGILSYLARFSTLVFTWWIQWLLEYLIMSQGESSIQATQVSSGSQRVSSNNREELISAVCRHLLAATGKRAVVRRDDISQYVGKGFKTKDIVMEASARLEQVFGLKVVELGMESKSGKTPSSSQVGGASSRLKGNGPVHKGYILINTLTQDDAYDGDDEECSFFGVLTVIVSFLLISPNSRLSEGMYGVWKKSSTVWWIVVTSK